MIIRLPMRISFLGMVLLCLSANVFAQQDRPRIGNPSGEPRGSGSITGRVVLPSGQPVNERVRITLSSLTDPGMVLYTDNQGEFGFQGLREGNYTIEVSADKKLYDLTTQEVRLIRGTHIRLMLPLKERGESEEKKAAGEVVSVEELSQNVPAAAKKEFENGVKLAGEGKINEAIERFQSAITIHPPYLMARNDLGVQYLKLKKYEQAIEQFESAIQINAKSFNPRLNLGIALVDTRKFTDALDQLNQAVLINSASPAARLYLGIAALETDELDRAFIELGKAQSLGGSDYVVAHFYRAQVYIKKGENDLAIRELNWFLEKVPSGEMAKRARAMLKDLEHASGGGQ